MATAAPGLPSLVSCMRSLMMACLSTEPAGAPGRLSGKSCGNWLFCRSSRISSKLSSSLPGCKQRKHGTRCCSPAVGVLLTHCCTCTGSRCSLQEAQCKAHKVVKKGLCRLPWAHLACSWRAWHRRHYWHPFKTLAWVHTKSHTIRTSRQREPGGFLS